MMSSVARRAAIGGALALALIGCALEPRPEPSASSTFPVRTVAPTTAAGEVDEALQALIDGWSADNDPVGVAAAALYPDGELWLGSAGLADRDRGVGVEPDDRFEIASLTKMFMSALTLRLAEDGVVDLDETIDGCMPGFPASDTITIRMLLGHRAGVRDPSAELVTDRFGPPDAEKVFTPAELAEAAAAGSPAFPPGSQHEYSNANYWVLAACLERATDTNTAELLQAYVFGPLGLTETILFDDSLPDVEVVNAYKDLDLDGVEDPMGTRPLPGLVTPAWTAGAIISSAEDVARFLDAVLSGDFLTRESLDAMLDTSSGGGSYALGIYISGGRWGHDGGIAGYLSAAFHDPRTGVTVVVLTNRFGPDAPQADVLAPQLANLANEFAR
jgi:D-alanyl-D-alanine carboxypeptidase